MPEKPENWIVTGGGNKQGTVSQHDIDPSLLKGQRKCLYPEVYASMKFSSGALIIMFQLIDNYFLCLSVRFSRIFIT